MDFAIYILLCLVYFVLGLASIFNLTFKNGALKWFIILTVLLPITKFTTEFHTNFQISVYYFFFIGPCILILVKLLRGKVNLYFYLSVFLLSIMLLFYIGHYFVFVEESRKAINILKDVKLFILIILGFVFIEVYRDRLKVILNRAFCDRLLYVNLIVCTVFFFLMYRFDIHLKLTTDPYYKYEELRLETLGCYFGIFYFLHLLFNRYPIKWYQFFICFLPLLYTGNRTLIFSIFAIVALFFLMRLTLRGVLIFISSSIVSIGGLLYLVFSADENSPLARFQKLFSLEYINYALMNRFSPFINDLVNYSKLDFIFGNGLGYTFFIPWFHYRDNIDDYNIYIDNLYLTLYAKFGVFFVVFFMIILLYFKSYLNSISMKLYFAFILILSITNAFIYQYNFLWIFIVMVFPFYNSYKK